MQMDLVCNIEKTQVRDVRATYIKIRVQRQLKYLLCDKTVFETKERNKNKNKNNAKRKACIMIKSGRWWIRNEGDVG